METFTIPLRPVLVFAVVLARVGGLVSFAPFWSMRAVPKRVRAALALVMALVITPAVMPRLATPPTDMLNLTLVIMGELLIGCALGFVGQLVFSGLEMAAHILSTQMGFTLAAIINPMTQSQTGPLGTMAQMCGLMVLMAADGHHWLLTGTVRSFQTGGPGHFLVKP